MQCGGGHQAGWVWVSVAICGEWAGGISLWVKGVSWVEMSMSRMDIDGQVVRKGKGKEKEVVPEAGGEGVGGEGEV